MKRLVLKLGTSTLTQGTPRISRGKIEDVARQIQALKDEYEIIIVSSGAIAAAKQFVTNSTESEVSVKQALAAIGQVHLMRFFQEIFSDYNLPIAQCLLTYYDFNNEDSQVNIKGTINTLLQLGYTPIINENDTVATDEIKFGDNDKLAALTAVLMDADLLILATDTDGLYNADPKLHPGAEIITSVDDLTPYIAAMADTKSAQGSGGMKSKLVAAQIAQGAQIETWILNGGEQHFIINACQGKSTFTTVK